MRRARIAAWRRTWISDAVDVDEDLFLFAVQSYWAAALKLIAAKLIGAPTTFAVSQSMECWRQIETGELYRGAGLDNFVLGDVYQAALHSNSQGVMSALAEIGEIVHAAESSPSAASLRALQLALFPRTVRHALGEYYTPEWLVSHMLDAIDVGEQEDVQILDPMCGGGVFLTGVLELRKDRSFSHSSPLTRIAGLEIHPLSILVARTAILTTILRARPNRTPDMAIALPVFQGDAILAAQRHCEAKDDRLDVPTPFGPLEVADDSSAVETVEAALRSSGAMGNAAAMIENARAIRRLPQFDFVVGNPPWVGWESLPIDYRNRTATLWNDYGLFAQRGMSAILGGGKKDLSMLATYAAADAWLKPGGLLAFVLSETAFKSVGAARGFRRFQIGGNESVSVVKVDDMTRLNPFANAATRTTIMVLKKGMPTRYPVPIVQWRKTSRRQALAAPTDEKDSQSPWLTASPSALSLLRRMLGRSTVRAFEGVNTGGANGVFWLRVIERTAGGNLIVENVPSRGRTPAPSIRAEIEATFVFPLLQHGDAGRWRATPSLSILLLQDPVRRRGVDVRAFETTAPMTLEYIQCFEKLLRKRAAFQRYFRNANGGEAPYYSMFNVGAYSLAPIKVVWKRMIAVPEAAVVTADAGPPVLPQETLCFITCAGVDEAFYYAGLINSAPFAAAALAVSQGSSKSFGAPHLLEMVRLPAFDPKNSTHQQLAACARRAASDSAFDDERLERTAAAVFGLSAEEAAVLADERDFMLSR